MTDIEDALNKTSRVMYEGSKISYPDIETNIFQKSSLKNSQSRSQPKTGSLPKKVVRTKKLKENKPSLSSLKIKEDIEQDIAPVLTSFKPLPTDEKTIQKMLKEEKDDNNSDKKFVWVGNTGIKKWFLTLILIFIILGIVFLLIFGIGIYKDKFKNIFNQTLNNTNVCTPVYNITPVCNNYCNLTCGNMTNNYNFTVYTNST